MPLKHWMKSVLDMPSENSESVSVEVPISIDWFQRRCLQVGRRCLLVYDWSHYSVKGGQCSVPSFHVN